MVERRTLEQEVGGSKPTSTVLCILCSNYDPVLTLTYIHKIHYICTATVNYVHKAASELPHEIYTQSQKVSTNKYFLNKKRKKQTRGPMVL